jgi:hypothetical protein
VVVRMMVQDLSKLKDAKKVLKQALIREVTSDILEIVFNDGDTSSNNLTGSYSIKLKHARNLPQLAPIMVKSKVLLQGYSKTIN